MRQMGWGKCVCARLHAYVKEREMKERVRECVNVCVREREGVSIRGVVQQGLSQRNGALLQLIREN